eukprot:2863420-Alexandrium_andersonii.AAC.1
MGKDLEGLAKQITEAKAVAMSSLSDASASAPIVDASDLRTRSIYLRTTRHALEVACSWAGESTPPECSP